MEYRPEFTWRVVGEVFLLPTSLIFFLIQQYLHHDYVWMAVYAILGIALFIRFNTFHLIKIIIFREIILMVNDDYIRDNYKRIKYYWKDIEIGEADGSNLKLRLYNPIDYIKNYDSSLKRFQVNLYCKLFKKVPSYGIDLALIATSKKMESVLETINNYSIVAESKG